MAEKGKAKRIALVGATASDVRDVIIEGPSGLLEISPLESRPRYEPSKRRLTWPNGAKAFCYSAEEPDRLRGPQHDLALADELAAWKYPQTLDMLLMGLRLGQDPRLVIATTPKNTPLVKRIIKHRGTAITRGRTSDNAMHLAPAFSDNMTASYGGTRLGRQELDGELIEFAEAAWFPMFSKDRHVSIDAEYNPNLPVMLAIDAGVSICTGAVFLQHVDYGEYKHKINIFGDFYQENAFSEVNARAIMELAVELCRTRLDRVRIDPAASARSGTGPAAFNEYERVFGNLLKRWPQHRVIDGLEHIELLLGTPDNPPDLIIHPRCTRLIEAFGGYERQTSRGEFLNVPKDPNHPHEDLMDALRGGIRDIYPQGRKIKPVFRKVRPEEFFNG
jgi:hypothetical protein